MHEKHSKHSSFYSQISLLKIYKYPQAIIVVTCRKLSTHLFKNVQNIESIMLFTICNEKSFCSDSTSSTYKLAF